MARRRKKRKVMGITSRYNRLVLGLQYFGVEKPTKKRATAKQLKELQKYYEKLRKDLKKQNPNIELPSIVQAAKYVEQQEPTRIIPETREPLPYSADEDEIPQIDFASNVIDQFLATLDDAVEEALHMYMNRPDICDAISRLSIKIHTTVSNLINEIGEENLAQFIASDLEYERLTQVHQLSYGETIELLDNILSDLEAILAKAKATFIPQNAINLENL